MSFVLSAFWFLFLLAPVAGAMAAVWSKPSGAPQPPDPPAKGGGLSGALKSLTDVATSVLGLPGWVSAGLALAMNPAAWGLCLFLGAGCVAALALAPGRAGVWVESALICVVLFVAGLATAATLAGAPLRKARGWPVSAAGVAAAWALAMMAGMPRLETSVREAARAAAADIPTLAADGRDVRVAGVEDPAQRERLAAAILRAPGVRAVVDEQGRPLSSEPDARRAAVRAGAKALAAVSPRAASVAAQAGVAAGDKAAAAVDALAGGAKAAAGALGEAQSVDGAIDAAADRAKTAIDKTKAELAAIAGGGQAPPADKNEPPPNKNPPPADRNAPPRDRGASAGDRAAEPQVVASTPEAPVGSRVETARPDAPVLQRAEPAPDAPPRPAPAAAAEAEPVASPEAAACKAALATAGAASIGFARNSARLGKAARDALARAAPAAAACPQVELVGHTDGRGDPARNQALSEERARAIQTFLTRRGVPAGRLVMRGLGAGEPVASNDDSAGRARNRRVDLIVR